MQITLILSEPRAVEQARVREQALLSELILLRKQALLREREAAAKLQVHKRKRAFSPFPYILLELAICAGFDGLEAMIGRAIRAIGRPRIR